MRKLLFFAIGIGALVVFGRSEPDHTQTEARESYRLVHAIGNTERIAATGMTMQACRAQQGELRTIATIIGAGGSITCLPDSLFAN